jgi:hypothetical protein
LRPPRAGTRIRNAELKYAIGHPHASGAARDDAIACPVSHVDGSPPYHFGKRGSIFSPTGGAAA